MLIELFGKNYGSFRDAFAISFLPTDIDRDSTEGLVPVDIEGDNEPLWLLRAIAIYGPNASGKSTLLRAASSLSFLINNSAILPSNYPLAYEPFALDNASSGLPVELGVRAVIDGKVYIYSVAFTHKEFVRERLVECLPKFDNILFERIGHDVNGTWTEEARFSLLRESFRPNALLLSLADRFAPDLAKNIAIGITNLLYNSDHQNWNTRRIANTPKPYISQRFATDPEFANWIVNLLRHADTGIVSHKVEELTNSARMSNVDDTTDDPNEKSKSYRVAFMHRGHDGTFEVNYGRESTGTQKTVDLGWFLYSLTHDHGSRAYFIDEIGSSLHPILISSLIRDFNRNIAHSEVRGQLVFATHETSLIDGAARDAVLRRDQVYFTEKGMDGASIAYSLSDFSERSNLNLRKRYLQGRYGAIPSNWTLFG